MFWLYLPLQPCPDSTPLCALPRSQVALVSVAYNVGEAHRLLLEQGYTEVVEAPQLPPAPAAQLAAAAPGPSALPAPLPLPTAGLSLSEATYLRNEQIYTVGCRCWHCGWARRCMAGGRARTPWRCLLLLQGESCAATALPAYAPHCCSSTYNLLLTCLPARPAPDPQEEREYQRRLVEARNKCRAMAAAHHQRGEYALADQLYRQAAKYKQQMLAEGRLASRRISKRV